MRKSALVMACLVTLALLASCKKDDVQVPVSTITNAKFIGHYEGTTLITGSYDINLTNMDPMHDDFVDNPVEVIAEIEAVEDVNKVTATITINEQANTVKGTVNGDKVVFEAIHDVYTMNYETQGLSIPVTLDMTYNITGTLNNGQLDLEGEFQGDGDVNLLFVNGTIDMEGIARGSLTKTK